MNPYAAALAGQEVVEFPIHGLDRLGVPVWTAATWDDDGVFCNGVGYGATDEEACTSAWGELWESLSVHRHLRDAEPVRARRGDLDDALDPRTLCLPAGSPHRPDDELAWVRGQRLGDGRPVWVPVEWVASRFADLPAGAPPPLITPITNGLGAGRTRADAAGHGLRELLQRDGNSVSYRALDRGRVLVPDDPGDEVAELLARMDDAGVEVLVKLADAPPGAHSLYVVGHDRDPARAPHPMALAACGEAADADPRRALRKALLEFAAARSRRVFNHAPLEVLAPVLPEGYAEAVRARPAASEEARALDATLRWLRGGAERILTDLAPVLARRTRTPLSSLGQAPPADAPLDVVVVPLTPPDAPMQAVKVVAPGLEVETMSYGRIGARNLARLRAAGETFAGLGAPPPGADPLVLPPDHPPAWLHRGRLDARVGPLYALYREPARHVAALALEAERAGVGAAP